MGNGDADGGPDTRQGGELRDTPHSVPIGLMRVLGKEASSCFMASAFFLREGSATRARQM